MVVAVVYYGRQERKYQGKKIKRKIESINGRKEKLEENKK